MFTGIAKFILPALLMGIVISATAQLTAYQPFKTLNVADGLPQSFISSLVQDSTGFIWIGTRDGLARYDGRKFKLFRHFPGDTATLLNNTISGLLLDKHNRLWIYYEGGDIDVLNTTTEKLFHFTSDPVFRVMYASLRYPASVSACDDGSICMLGKSGIFVCNIERHSMRYYSAGQLALNNVRIMSLAARRKELLLVTDTALVTLDGSKHISGIVPFTFANPHLYNASDPYKSEHFLTRANGEIIIMDGCRILICNPFTKTFTVRMLPAASSTEVSCMVQDNQGAVFFDFNADLYRLSPENELKVWNPHPDVHPHPFAARSMLLDRSGVLWVGGNGNGLTLFDLRLSRLTAFAYEKSFHEDVFTRILQVPASEIPHTFLANMQPYLLRWTKDRDGKIWFSRGGGHMVRNAQVGYYDKGHLVFPEWHYTDTLSASHAQINALAFSASGKLWGVDFYLRPVSFDTCSHAVRVYPQFASPVYDPSYTVNSMLMDGETTMWVTTSLQGLYRHNVSTGKTILYRQDDRAGSLPGNQLMNMVNDPVNSQVMWISSLGSGLIQFNKNTGRCRTYTTKNGLPNNTIYAVMADAQGLLWCSSNKGFFSFDPQTGMVRSFTSKDGLPGDEFNRFHYLQLPDNRIALGGVDGYTVFNPKKLPDDTARPVTALTGFSIANIPADAGTTGSPIHQAINSLDKVVLPYNRNFITFDFAALEFNISEKLQYRYMLQGFNDKWIYSGTDNTASYTNIPPGSYLLKVNATNTAGRWSSHVKTLRLIIEPPFWRTWWFACICTMACIGIISFLISKRIAAVRKEEQQKWHFEQEALELKAQALRAQMNPHFIFNCLNSIKALIQEDNKRQAVTYLTTFSKLIRSQLNSVQQEVTLHEELETCRLYVQLESLRFSTKVLYEFITDEQVDTHSFMVPPLILQPFIENAIWHGILPGKGGKVTIAVTLQPDGVRCTIDDNGIGRETSMLGKSQNIQTYQSKGMKLVQNRLHFYNILRKCDYNIEVIDKRDPAGRPAGTLVIVNFKNKV